MAKRKSSTLTPDILFDPRLGSTGRYVSKATGQIVSVDVVQDALEKNIDRARSEMLRVSERMYDGKISLAGWRGAMAEQMRIVHTQSAALAKGGWANMSQSDWGFVGSLVKKQLRFLDDFAMDIQDNPGLMSKLNGEISGNFLRRVGLYADAGNTTKSEIERRVARQNGVITHEMRLLDPAARHCNCCLVNANIPKPLGELPPIGACDCTTKCRCRFVFGVMVNGEFREV